MDIYSDIALDLITDNKCQIFLYSFSCRYFFLSSYSSHKSLLVRTEEEREEKKPASVCIHTQHDPVCTYRQHIFITKTFNSSFISFFEF